MRVGDKALCTRCNPHGLAEPIPWEQPAGRGWWRALRMTTRAALATPAAFYSTPSVCGVGRPIMYGGLVYMIGIALLGATFALTFGGIMVGAAVVDEQPVMAAVGVGYALCMTVSYALQGAVYGFLGIVLGGSLSHLSLWLLGCRDLRYEDSLRVVSYANAPLFWLWVPVVGWLAAYPWMLWLEITGMRRVHDVSLDKALVAVLGYRVLLFFVVGGLYALFLGALFYLELESP